MGWGLWVAIGLLVSLGLPASARDKGRAGRGGRVFAWLLARLGPVVGAVTTGMVASKVFHFADPSTLRHTGTWIFGVLGAVAAFVGLRPFYRGPVRELMRKLNITGLAKVALEDSPQVRGRAVDALADVAVALVDVVDPRVSLSLASGLASEDASRRQKSVNALKALVPTGAVEHLLAACRDERPEIRGYAAAGLAALGSEAFPELLEIIEADDPRVRALAIVGLAPTVPALVAEPLVKTLSDHDPLVKNGARQAFQERSASRKDTGLLQAVLTYPTGHGRYRHLPPYCLPGPRSRTKTREFQPEMDERQGTIFGLAAVASMLGFVLLASASGWGLGGLEGILGVLGELTGSPLPGPKLFGNPWDLLLGVGLLSTGVGAALLLERHRRELNLEIDCEQAQYGQSVKATLQISRRLPAHLREIGLVCYEFCPWLETERSLITGTMRTTRSERHHRVFESWQPVDGGQRMSEYVFQIPSAIAFSYEGFNVSIAWMVIARWRRRWLPTRIALRPLWIVPSHG